MSVCNLDIHCPLVGVQDGWSGVLAQCIQQGIVHQLAAVPLSQLTYPPSRKTKDNRQVVHAPVKLQVGKVLGSGMGTRHVTIAYAILRLLAFR